MTTTSAPSTPPRPGGVGGALDRAEGVELLGSVQGSGYRDGAALVRRGDGQMVRLGPLMYGLLECIDGRRDAAELAAAMTDRLGRRLDEQQVALLADKLAAQGLLAGTEQAAPPRSNPLLALRWRVLVTDPAVTSRLTGPFTVLFRPWVMWPVLAAFVAVCWFVLIDKGVSSATADAFDSPGLLLLVFALAVLSAGLHELGHAAACQASGATPGGMGMGLYLVWPAFYTDVTDAYRLPRRSRLRIDLAGLYFNAAVAVLTTAVWLVVRRDALLLLVALQLLQMVKQLSPIIRADGYHILADATGVPDLYAHLGPTLRRLIPGRRREPSALTGRARLVVTIWVLVVVPVLLALMVGAVLLIPRLLTNAWASGERLVTGLPHQLGAADILGVLGSLLQLLALVLPVLGSLLVTQQIVRTGARAARNWSDGRPGRRIATITAAGAVVAALLWAWWPSGQYQPVRPADDGTLPSLVQLLGDPKSAVRPAAAVTPAATPAGAPETSLALAAVPQGGPSAEHPALLVLPGGDGEAPTAVISTGPGGTTETSGGPGTSEADGTEGSGSVDLGDGVLFPFRLPDAPGPGDTQALAVGREDGGVVYDISYALVTIADGSDVTDTNSAYALASCDACTTVAVSFQVVLVVGQSDVIAPVNLAEALNLNCPSCLTTAIAAQIVLTVSELPPAELQQQLQEALAQLGELTELGVDGTPAAVAAHVATVLHQVETILDDSGLSTGADLGSADSGSTATGGTGPTTTAPSTGTAEPTPTARPSSASPETTSPGTTSAGDGSTSAPTSSPPETPASSTSSDSAAATPTP